MQVQIQLRPEDLVEARLDADAAAGHEPTRGAVGIQSIGLGVHPGLQHASDEGRIRLVAAGPPQAHQALRGHLEACRASQHQPALEACGGHGDLPALAFIAEAVIDRHARILEENLREARLAMNLADPPYAHARMAQRHEDEAQSLVALGGSLGAKDAEAPVGKGRARGPDLVSAEDVAVARHGPRSHAAPPGPTRPAARTSPAPRSPRPRPSAAGSAPSARRSRTP